MPTFGRVSLDRLATCDGRLQTLFKEIILHWDCSILCGHRDKETQNKAYSEGTSKVTWPNSKHNTFPSLAVDVAPWPIEWPDTKEVLAARDNPYLLRQMLDKYSRAWGRFYMFAGFVLGKAQELNIPIRSGLDWNGNFEIKDENFFDAPHFEIKQETANVQ